MDRQPFLDLVRARLDEGPPSTPETDGSRPFTPELPVGFPATPATGDGTADPERFLAGLAAAGGTGRIVPRSELEDAVRDLVTAMRSSRRTVVTADTDPYREDLDRGLEAGHAEVIRPEPVAWRDEAARADLGITGATLGVASTGSVLLLPGAGSPRVASLLPTQHLVLLPVDRLVAGLEDVMPVLAGAADGASSAVLVTGPSRTSDIEMTTVLGMHGPKALHILLVDDRS
jgi:L-lactate utilization protein LutC